MSQLVDVPIYRKIALDIAGRICSGEFREGDRIYGRSTLAGEYNVSPETIRRAVTLLEDMNVVNTSQGSGIHIKSQLKAYEFIERLQSKESVQTLKTDIKKLLIQKQSIENDINEIINKIIDYSDRLKNVNPLTPMEIEVEAESHLIGKTVTDSKFWQNTGATIIGIRRNGLLLLSPGPYAGFEKGDSIFVVGEVDILEKIRKFMRQKE